MTKAWKVLVASILFVGLTATAAWAGNPHFVGTPSCSPNTGLTTSCSGKVAGLGNEPDIFVRVTAEAACINRGNNHPQAANKETVEGKGKFPVQNGKANFSVTLTANLSPPCSPPMVIQWTLQTVTVYTGCTGDFEGGDLTGCTQILQYP